MFKNKNPNKRGGFPGERHMFLPTEYGLTRANYAGPGTHLKERLSRNDPPVDGPRGIDIAAKQHDIDYSNAKVFKDVRRADNRFIKRVRKSEQSSFAKNIVIGAMKSKKFGENIGIFKPDTFTNVDLEGSGMKEIDFIYESILKNVEDVLGNKTTYSGDLDIFCKKYFGNRFKGVFPSDMVPILNTNELCIINLDKSNQSGSHWVALANENGDLYFYDSFGRKQENIINISGGTKYDTQDGEQKEYETNCGQRAITFLIIGKHFGFDLAIEI